MNWKLRGFKRFIFIILILVCLTNLIYAQNNELELVRLSQVVLYQPNSALERRVNVVDLSNYIKDIMKCYNDYLLSKNYKNESSAIILFAVNSNHNKKIWLIDNYNNLNNVELNFLLMNINSPLVNESSVAAAIFIGNYNELNANINNGLYLPEEWLEIPRNNNRQFTIDDILDIILEG